MASQDEYSAKRNSAKTPEPKANEKSVLPTNHFVVQKHEATNLHFDFRLQVGSSLISWAVPKGPPEKVGDKRLAIHVEDHPLAYMYFEGNIPKGQYGGGTVMVWDVGYYFLEGNPSNPSPAEVRKAIAKGKLKIQLKGNRLNGVFTLVKGSKGKENQWLLLKNTPDEPDEDRSVLTNRSLSEISEGRSAPSPENETNTANPVAKKAVPKKKAPKQKFPGFISPMLATAVEDFYEDPDWLYELKLDGYRIQTLKNEEEVSLLSRNENDYTKPYAAIAKELADVQADFIVDGEVCMVDSDGKTNFQKLQNHGEGSAELTYFVFDLLWLNGHDLTELPLFQRKELLKQLVSRTPDAIKFVPHQSDGNKALQEAKDFEQEGLILKRADSTYDSGRRSKQWLKYKFSERQEMIICGYLPSSERNSGLRSLLCCLHKGEELVYTGKVGTGFGEESGKKIIKSLERVTRKSPPQVENLPSDKEIIWVKPELMCEVRFTEWTTAGHMRHPSFMGMRADKSPDEIKVEVKVAPPPEGLRFELSNPDKVFWPKKGMTKKDVFDYYNGIADFILPYLADRPLSLHRTPDGIKNKGFFQKDMADLAPDWLDTFTVEGKEKKVEYALCQNKEALLYLVNLGCVEFHPWNALIGNVDHADLLVFDLDPLDIAFSKVIEVGLKLKGVLDDLDIQSYPKTSGSKGFHVFVPIVNNLPHKQVQAFAKRLLLHVHKLNPAITSLERSPQKRKGKVYLDYLQNGRGKTMASIYSLRPVEAATVSTPLYWDEVNEDLNPEQFSMRRLLIRLQEKGEVWQGFFGNRLDLKKKFGLG